MSEDFTGDEVTAMSAGPTDYKALIGDGTYYPPEWTAHKLADAVEALVAERDAYKRAKAENDERFMIERDEARAGLADSEARRVELEAALGKVRSLVMNTDGDYLNGEAFDGLAGAIQQALSVPPSTVLGEHDQEVAARALEDAAWSMWPDKGPDGAYLASVWLRELAAAIRAGKA